MPYSLDRGTHTPDVEALCNIVQDLGNLVWGATPHLRVDKHDEDSGFEVEGVGFGVSFPPAQGSGLRLRALGFRVWGATPHLRVDEHENSFPRLLPPGVGFKI